MSAEKTVTSSSILPSLALFETTTLPEEGDSNLIVNMKAAAKKNFKYREGMIAKDILYLACILDPRTKEMNFLSREERKKAKSLLKKKAHETASASESDAPLVELPSSSEPPPTKRVKRELFQEDDYDWLSGVIESDTASESESDAVDRELERYHAEPFCKANPLDWWKERESIFPVLSMMAKVYLSFPASSVSSERIFSLAGNIVNKKRTLLHHENVDMLIFLNKNKINSH